MDLHNMPNSFVHGIYKIYRETSKPEREAMEMQNQLEEVMTGG